MRDLSPGYQAEIDTVDHATWCRLLLEFDDANIFQTWPYATVTSGRRNAARVIVRRNGSVVSLAQARIVKLPIANIGVAYIRWGPLWRRRGSDADVECLRQTVRALRNEFVCKRGLVLRLLPVVSAGDAGQLESILEDEGFSPQPATGSSTLIMDLTPPLAALRDGMRPHWKRYLKVAERNNLEVIEGSDDDLFSAFLGIYGEMVSRKRFFDTNNVSHFREIQRQLPDRLKMKVMLCRADGEIGAGLVCSAIGNTGLYLLGATSNAGLTRRGSYLLHWRLIETLKKNGVTAYDLNGINPTKNPGTYKFKRDLAGTHGREVDFPGRFDSGVNPLSVSCVAVAESVKSLYRTLQTFASPTRGDGGGSPDTRAVECPDLGAAKTPEKEAALQ